jgi:hypothetical protein
MDIDTIITEKPYFKLTKEYPEGQLKIEDLTEVLMVTIKVKLANYEESGTEDEILQKSMRHFFFTDFEKAWKQYKFWGPRGAVLLRMFTDDEELINIAKKSNDIVYDYSSLEKEEDEENKPETIINEAPVEQPIEEKI